MNSDTPPFNNILRLDPYLPFEGCISNALKALSIQKDSLMTCTCSQCLKHTTAVTLPSQRTKHVSPLDQKIQRDNLIRKELDIKTRSLPKISQGHSFIYSRNNSQNKIHIPSSKRRYKHHPNVQDNIPPQKPSYVWRYVDPINLASQPEKCTGSRKHQCIYCPKTFPKKNNLIRHLRVHDPNPLTWNCETCNKPFGSKSNLTRHTKCNKLL
ncbi:zinc finger C2H2-type transcription factor [Phycomyces blakesleeanus]|uniref:Zinc finger C2H2-type transcription factor n=2 Tax=Phycomyces blakesleeanus TaxID=4837 RepID=A0A167QF26_PHYB8|nr:zinc finger C2H2-type transcription factor [Phycomyces blakesleeanus NRRL 1555(-)]OAD79601.1 zinc finger C2H2-type transcription factor [Phycomyces blakesleeanus NRRL 1555(-)]|eukprot:XP_018297641.1 zinc finger C2H2-type transcription factor [Phycomyces blakesleeanus NRRL 1555(-)]